MPAIATFNFYNGGSSRHWEELLNATQADVLFVQEARDPGEVLTSLFAPFGPDRVHWAPVSHGKWGSRIWLRSGELDRIDLSAFEGWVTAGYTDLEGEEWLIASVHIPSGRSSYTRLAHDLLDSLAPHIAGRPVLLAGDWNLTVGRRHPREELQCRPDELMLLERIEDEFGPVSAWQSRHPERPLVQTLRWVSNKVPPFHCDGVFLPADRCPPREAEVLQGEPWTTLSDHNPVVVSW